MNKKNNTQKKNVAIALQGGGSHGAYTWGVLDSILEDNRIHVEGVSGTSAGGMNAAALAQGINKGGNAEARNTLRALWGKIGELAQNSPIKVDPMNKALKKFNISQNPAFLFMQYMSNMLSPYQFNPQNIHPLADVVEDLFDFNELQSTKHCKLFLCATHVASGKLKIFKGNEISHKALLASACVPSLFQAVEVNEEYYWDGGFIGNPAIYPLIDNCDTADILIIQIRRVHDPKLPTTVHEIQNRLGEITQNSCLTREMRTIAFITKLIDDGVVAPDALKRLYVHMVRDDAFFSSIDRASGFCNDPEFLDHLFKAGRRAGKKWIEDNYDSIGKKTTADIEYDFV